MNLSLESNLSQMQDAAVILAESMDDVEKKEELADIAQIASLVKQMIEKNGMPLGKVLEAMNYVGPKINNLAE